MEEPQNTQIFRVFLDRGAVGMLSVPDRFLLIGVPFITKVSGKVSSGNGEPESDDERQRARK
ncbi:MAG: hypothetical protein ACPLYX_08340 [Rectinema subterraneum]|uniref:hypothetical protein n=1 Tax=Rectinema subterraneum TaxID=2653714 RepID=UPI003C7CC980